MPELTFGWRLRMARQMAGLSVDAAARAINVSPAALSAWERQAWQPRYGVDLAVEALAQLYEADAQWILTGKPSDDAEVLSGTKPEPKVVDRNPYAPRTGGSRTGRLRAPRRPPMRPRQHLSVVRSTATPLT